MLGRRFREWVITGLPKRDWTEFVWRLVLLVMYPLFSSALVFSSYPRLNTLELLLSTPFSPALGVLCHLYGRRSKSMFSALVMAVFSVVSVFSIFGVGVVLLGAANYADLSGWSSLIIGSIIGFSLMSIGGSLEARRLKGKKTRVKGRDLNSYWDLLTAGGFILVPIWAWTLIIIAIRGGR